MFNHRGSTCGSRVDLVTVEDGAHDSEEDQDELELNRHQNTEGMDATVPYNDKAVAIR